MIGKAVCIRQAALINARRRSLNEWKEHINNLKDAQVMKSCFDRIRKKEEADSSKKTGDNNSMGLWTLLLSAAAAGIVLTLVWRRRSIK